MPAFEILGIDNVLLAVGDRSVARRFYGAVLGEPREIHTGWVVEVADPWGNVIGLTDYTEMPERARR